MGRGSDRKQLSWPPTQELQTHPPPKHTHHPQHIYTHLLLTGPDTPSLWQSNHTPLCPEKVGHTTHLLGPGGLPGVVRRAGPWPQGAHWGSLLRIPRIHLPHQGSTESTGLCAASPGPGSTSISTLSPHTPTTRQCLAAVTMIHP